MATEWMEIEGAIANMGEDDERIIGNVDGTNLAHVCWWSCGNIKMASISGISNFTMASLDMVQKAFDFLGDNQDYEVAVPVIAHGKALMLAIDCCDCVTLIGCEDMIDGIDAVCDEYDPSDCADLPEEVISFFDLDCF